MSDHAAPKSSRRKFLVGAGTAAAAAALTGGTPARAQTGVPARVPAGPVTTAAAETVLRNGKIITVDAGFTVAQAVAVAGDRIVAVGPNEAMAAHVSPSTRVIDLNGRSVMPGLTDGHAHFDREGLRNVFPSLGPVRSIRDIQDRIAELARGKKPGEWIVTMPIGEAPFYFGVPDNLAEKRWPMRQELDQAAPNNPVLIRSIWGYWRGTFPLVSCANTAALRRAGITRDTLSPVESVTIEKDANGDPSGVFSEREMRPVAELYWFREATQFSHEERVRALAESARAYHAFGTTSIFEGHGIANEVLRAYKEAHRNGTLTMRSSLVFSGNWPTAGDAPFGPFIEAWAGWLGGPGLGDDWLKMQGLHVTTADPGDKARATAAPYTGWAGFNNAQGLPRDKVKELLLLCAENDIRVVMIGSRNLDLFDEVDRKIPLKDRRWSLAHITQFSPRDIERIVRMGLVLTTQTNGSLYKGLHTLAAQVPRDQHDEIVPLRSLLDAGVKVSLATDNVPISLFLPVWETMARTSFVTKERVSPDQALTRADALRCVTTNGAYLTFDEDKKGTLQAGKFADLAVLSADPLTVAQDAVPEITSLMTMVGGRIVHEMPNWYG